MVCQLVSMHTSPEFNQIASGYAHTAASRVMSNEKCGSKHFVSARCAEVILTADGVMRGAKPIPLKGVVDDAIAKCTTATVPALGLSGDGGHQPGRVFPKGVRSVHGQSSLVIKDSRRHAALVERVWGNNSQSGMRHQ